MQIELSAQKRELAEEMQAVRKQVGSLPTTKQLQEIGERLTKQERALEIQEQKRRELEEQVRENQSNMLATFQKTKVLLTD